MAKKFFLGMLIALVPGLAIADPALNGTWVDEIGAEFKFNNGNWEVWEDGYLEEKGTYTASGGTITMRETSIHGSRFILGTDTGWYTRSEVISLAISEFEAVIGEDFLNDFLALLRVYPPEELHVYLSEAAEEVDEMFADLNEAFDSELAEVAGMITRTMSAEMNAAPELAEIIEKISEFLAKAFFIGLEEALDEKFWAETGTYSVSGNTLTITFDHDPITLTRK